MKLSCQPLSYLQEEYDHTTMCPPVSIATLVTLDTLATLATLVAQASLASLVTLVTHGLEAPAQPLPAERQQQHHDWLVDSTVQYSIVQ